MSTSTLDDYNEPGPTSQEDRKQLMVGIRAPVGRSKRHRIFPSSAWPCLHRMTGNTKMRRSWPCNRRAMEGHNHASSSRGMFWDTLLSWLAQSSLLLIPHLLLRRRHKYSHTHTRSRNLSPNSSSGIPEKSCSARQAGTARWGERCWGGPQRAEAAPGSPSPPHLCGSRLEVVLIFL